MEHFYVVDSYHIIRNYVFWRQLHLWHGILDFWPLPLCPKVSHFPYITRSVHLICRIAREKFVKISTIQLPKKWIKFVKTFTKYLYLLYVTASSFQYRVALRIAKDPRIERLICSHKGTYADDCLVQRVQEHKCYIVATNDKDLRRRIRKIPGVPIMFVQQKRYSIERMPDAFGAPRTWTFWYLKF